MGDGHEEMFARLDRHVDEIGALHSKLILLAGHLGCDKIGLLADLANLGWLNKTHFNKKSGWLLQPTAILVSAAQDKTFLRACNCNKAIPSFFFHLGAAIALLSTLI